MFPSKTGWQVQVSSKLPLVLPQVNCKQMSAVKFERFTLWDICWFRHNLVFERLQNLLWKIVAQRLSQGHHLVFGMVVLVSVSDLSWCDVILLFLMIYTVLHHIHMLSQHHWMISTDYFERDVREDWGLQFPKYKINWVIMALKLAWTKLGYIETDWYLLEFHHSFSVKKMFLHQVFISILSVSTCYT